VTLTAEQIQTSRFVTEFLKTHLLEVGQRASSHLSLVTPVSLVLVSGSASSSACEKRHSTPQLPDYT
jgi:hypothetical protein